MRTTAQHRVLWGEYSWHKYEPTWAILCGVTQVSLRWTTLLVGARQPDAFTSKHRRIYKHIHTQSPVYIHVPPDSAAWANMLIAQPMLSNSCISHWVWGASGRKREFDVINDAVMKEHWSPAVAHEAFVHGTKLQVMRTRVSVLTLGEEECQVWEGATTCPAITTQLPASSAPGEPIIGLRPPLRPAPFVKLSEKHKDWLNELIGQLMPVSFHLYAPPFSDGQMGRETLPQLPGDNSSATLS